MNKVLKKAAEILVECGYALTASNVDIHPSMNYGKTWCVSKEPSGSVKRYIFVDPFADTLEGRRQADAIEDWLSENHPFSWHQSSYGYEAPQSHHQWRLERIRVALEQLGEQDE